MMTALPVATWWLGRCSIALVVLALAGSCWVLFGHEASPGRRAARSYLSKLERRLRFLRLKPRAKHLVSAQVVGFVGCLALILVCNSWLVGLCIPFLAVVPSVLLEQLSVRRVTRVEAQLEPWLTAVANGLKASPSLGEAIAGSISVVPAPMSEEVDLVVKEYELGIPLDQALYDFEQRMESQVLAGALLALKVARRSGGDLPRMLKGAAESLRELARLEGVVRTKTAEGKAQAVVIAAIPVPMVAGLQWLEPEFFEPLFRTFLGNFIIVIVAVLWLMAVLLAVRILRVDV